MSFDRIPRPIQRVIRQINGPLAIVQDGRNFYWIINRKNGRHVPERFEGLEAAKSEASTLLFLHKPEARKPSWTTPVDGRAAQTRFDRWAER
jgi:hypothetical protein